MVPVANRDDGEDASPYARSTVAARVKKCDESRTSRSRFSPKFGAEALRCSFFLGIVDVLGVSEKSIKFIFGIDGTAASVFLPCCLVVLVALGSV